MIPHSKIEKRGKYIFFYQLSISKEAVEFTKRLSKYYGYDIIQVSGRVEPLLFGKQYFQTAGPLDFLSLINNAEIVVSTSFHGVAFSVLFEKQFFAMGMKKNSGRVENLLNELGIPERLSKADGTDFNLREEIDYRNIRSKIIELRKKSQDYLFSALKKDVKI